MLSPNQIIESLVEIQERIAKGLNIPLSDITIVQHEYELFIQVKDYYVQMIINVQSDKVYTVRHRLEKGIRIKRTNDTNKAIEAFTNAIKKFK